MKEKWMFGPGLRKALKGVHMTLVAMAGGGMLAVVMLLAVKTGSAPSEASFPVDMAVFRLFSWGVNYAFFGIIATSFLYGLFTEWGFFRHYWIVVKWLVLAGLFAITWFWSGPQVNGLVSLSDSGFHLTARSAEYAVMGKSALASVFLELVLFIALIFLSVIKPWGPTNWKLPYNRKAVLITVLALAAIGAGMALLQSVQFSAYRNAKISDTRVDQLVDGIYRGSSDFGIQYHVEVTVSGGRITSVSNLGKPYNEYVFYAEGVFTKIIHKQNANVDAVTGATTSSKAFMKAVENALGRKN